MENTLKRMERLFIACTCLSVIAEAACIGEQVVDNLALGNPESNILTKSNRDDFMFTVHPSPASGWGYGKNVADES